jgi:hypothetical protein
LSRLKDNQNKLLAEIDATKELVVKDLWEDYKKRI